MGMGWGRERERERERRGDPPGVVGCVQCHVYVVSGLGFGVQIKVLPWLLTTFPSSALWVPLSQAYCSAREWPCLKPKPPMDSPRPSVALAVVRNSVQWPMFFSIWTSPPVPAIEAYLYLASMTTLSTVLLRTLLTFTIWLSFSRRNMIPDWLTRSHMKNMETLEWMAPATQLSLYLLDLALNSSAWNDLWKHLRDVRKCSLVAGPLWAISGPISTWSKDVKMFTILGCRSRSGFLHPSCYVLVSVWQPSTVSCCLTS